MNDRRLRDKSQLYCTNEKINKTSLFVCFTAIIIVVHPLFIARPLFESVLIFHSCSNITITVKRPYYIISACYLTGTLGVDSRWISSFDKLFQHLTNYCWSVFSDLEVIKYHDRWVLIKTLYNMSVTRYRYYRCIRIKQTTILMPSKLHSPMCYH